MIKDTQENFPKSPEDAIAEIHFIVQYIRSKVNRVLHYIRPLNLTSRLMTPMNMAPFIWKAIYMKSKMS